MIDNPIDEWKRAKAGLPPAWLDEMLSSDNLKPHPTSSGASVEVAEVPRVEWIKGADIFGDLPKIEWVVPGLYLCRGRPCELVGFGYSGKTVAAMDLALSVAAGRPVWGQFQVKQGKAMHIDHEQGRYATQRRYKRLAYAAQITPHDVGDRLRFCALPDIRLTDSEAEGWLLKECEGSDVCVIDSLRATLLGIDENDSAVRAYIDKLLRVSENTGCVFILIHHSGKGRKEGDQREGGRGSSAIYDAAGTVIKLDPEKHGEDEVTISKAVMTKAAAEASGSAVSPFWLRIEDIANDDGSDLRAGLRCSYVESFDADKDADKAKTLARCADVLQVLRERMVGLSTNELQALVTGRAADTKRSLELLKLEGKVTVNKRDGRGGGWEWRAAK